MSSGCPRYDHSMDFSTTSMYPLGLSVDVNRPGVIMIQTDVAQSFLMTPHQLLQHIVHADFALPSSPCISDRHQDDTKAACIPPRRHLVDSLTYNLKITLVSGQGQIDARCGGNDGPNRCWGCHQSVVRFKRNSMTTRKTCHPVIRPVSHADHTPTRDGESIRRQPGPRGRVRNKPTVCSTMVKNNPTTYAVIGFKSSISFHELA